MLEMKGELQSIKNKCSMKEYMSEMINESGTSSSASGLNDKV